MQFNIQIIFVKNDIQVQDNIYYPISFVELLGIKQTNLEHAESFTKLDKSKKISATFKFLKHPRLNFKMLLLLQKHVMVINII